MRCPRCKSPEVFKSKSGNTWLQGPLQWIIVCVRCHSCSKQFYRRGILLAGEKVPTKTEGEETKQVISSDIFQIIRGGKFAIAFSDFFGIFCLTDSLGIRLYGGALRVNPCARIGRLPANRANVPRWHRVQRFGVLHIVCTHDRTVYLYICKTRQKRTDSGHTEVP